MARWLRDDSLLRRIESVSRFAVYTKWAHEGDTARFKIPARKGSGEYLVHM